MLLSKFFYSSILLIISGCAISDSSVNAEEGLNQIDHALNQGLAVIVYQMKNSDKASEQYADWAGYLNDFVDSRSSTYRVYPADAEFFLRLANKKIDTSGDFTVFMKKGSPGYFYQGVIVEPMVYFAVDRSYSKTSLSAMDKAFLPERIELQ